MKIIFTSKRSIFSSSSWSKSPSSNTNEMAFISTQAKAIEDQFINKEYSHKYVNITYVSRLQEYFLRYTQRRWLSYQTDQGQDCEYH